jgi:uncharacterized SAM-binding protein YcdF (DUF218 family)
MSALFTHPARRDVLRFAGAAVGVFLLVNIAGQALRGPFDTTGDWVSWPATPWLRRALALLLGAALIANAFVRGRPAWLRGASTWLFGGAACVASIDALRFAAVLLRGRVVTPAVLPSSAVVAVFFAALAWDARALRIVAVPEARRRFQRLAAVAVVVLGLPLLRMATFGPSRYERRADCAVVFGARVWRSGRPSDALADRVDEAVRLYHRGLVRCIVMSGAMDPEVGFSEPIVMRDRAEAQGVPAEAILLDEAGVDTASTVRNTARLLRAEGLSRVLVVTHYYHEPRAKMLFDRAGIQSYTVPAHMSRRLVKEPYFLLREVAAYYHSFLLE